MYTESETVELKQAYTKDIIKEIIAFLNTHGGTIYIGVTDDGDVIGIENFDKTLNQFSSAVHDNIQPDAKALIRIMENEEHIICVHVLEGVNKPYYIKGKGLRPDGVYVRLGASSVPSSESGIKRMLIESTRISFEKLPSAIQNLTFNRTRDVFMLNQMTFDENDCRKLMLLDEKEQFNNAAYVLSDASNYSVKIAVFSSTNTFEFMDRREFVGPILDVLEKSLEYVHLSNHLKSKVVGYRREERYDYDPKIIREGLMNALIHRDYAYSGSVMVKIYVDRIEIVSLGGLSYGLSIEDIENGISQSRNPILAGVLYRLKYVEAYGTGIQKIRKEYADYDLSDLIKVTDNTFKLTLWNKNYEDQQEVREQTTVYGSLTREEEWILDFVAQEEHITRRQAEELLAVGQTKAGLILKTLSDKGYLEKVGKGKRTIYLKKD